jgi:hypothetical protein
MKPGGQPGEARVRTSLASRPKVGIDRWKKGGHLSKQQEKQRRRQRMKGEEPNLERIAIDQLSRYDLGKLSTTEGDHTVSSCAI